MKIFLGIVLVAVGVAVVLKTEWLIENFGTNAWAETNLGTSGGSRMLYKLIGLAFVFIGFMMITGLFGPFLLATVGKLFTPSK